MKVKSFIKFLQDYTVLSFEFSELHIILAHPREEGPHVLFLHRAHWKFKNNNFSKFSWLQISSYILWLFFYNMATPGVMKLLEEKNVDKGISHFVWSPKMDIIAVASEQNDTSLYRLNFQKVSHETGPNFQKVSFRIGHYFQYSTYSHCIRFGQQNPQTLAYRHWHGDQTERSWQWLTKMVRLNCLTLKTESLCWELIPSRKKSASCVGFRVQRAKFINKPTIPIIHTIILPNGNF